MPLFLREIFCDGFDVGTPKVANVISQVAAHVDFAVGISDFINHLPLAFEALTHVPIPSLSRLLEV